MASIGGSPSKASLPCPSCKSANTIQTTTHADERFFFCVDCDLSWLEDRYGDKRILRQPRPR